MTEDELKVRTLAQLDQRRAECRDAAAKMGTAPMIGVLLSLSLAPDWRTAWESLSVAPERWRDLFALLVMEGLSVHIAEQLGLEANEITEDLDDGQSPG